MSLVSADKANNIFCYVSIWALNTQEKPGLMLFSLLLTSHIPAGTGCCPERKRLLFPGAGPPLSQQPFHSQPHLARLHLTVCSASTGFRPQEPEELAGEGSKQPFTGVFALFTLIPALGTKINLNNRPKGTDLYYFLDFSTLV